MVWAGAAAYGDTYKVVDLGRLLNSQVQRRTLTVSWPPVKTKPEQAPVLGTHDHDHDQCKIT